MTCRLGRTVGVVIAVTFAAAALAGRAAAATERELIGYDELAARPGALLAKGAGITVAQVEAVAPGTTDYAPDVNDAALAGKTFTYRSGAAGVSGHASMVARLYYGRDAGAAPGASDVLLFSAGSFVDGLLRAGKPKRGPGAVKAQVVNNSWVAAFSTDAANVDAVRRLDDLIVRQDVLVFNAVENDGTKAIPRLLASSYNGVSVGTLDAAHGPFTFDAPGPRIKPDLVVDTALTSNAAALASSAGTLLRSEAKARGMTVGEAAIKAIMMAGAERDADWHRGRSSGSDNRTAPLDFQQGAGQLRVDRAFDIVMAGEHAPGSALVPAEAGWDAARTPRRASQATTYRFRVDETIPKWSAVLTWNRVIEGLADAKYSTAATLADFDLSLYRQRAGGRRLVARSDSPNDNVETLTLTGLTPGTYQLVLTPDRRSRYAIAWYAGEDDADLGAAVRAASVGVGGGMFSASGDGFLAVQAPEPSSLISLLLPVTAILVRRHRARV